MNKKFMIGGCAAAVVAGNMFAADESISYFNPYASLKAGYAFLGKRNDIKYKGGFAGAVELGVSYDAWRLGLELGYKSNKIKEAGGNKYNYMLGGKIKLDAMAANNLADLRDNSIFRSSAQDRPFYGAAQNHWYLKDVTRAEMTKLTALTGMVNVFYDYAMTEAWSVYAGIGLGVARVAYTTQTRSFKGIHDLDCNQTNLPVGGAASAAFAALPDTVKTAYGNALGTIFDNINDLKVEASKTVFAWQLMAGFGYEFNENWKLTLGYKLFNTAKVKLGDTKIKTPFNHTAELGLTYAF
jgi:opacity protein-like surface antigen